MPEIKALQTKQQMQDEVVYTNRVEFLKAEHDRLLKAKETLAAEISRKTTDYELYMGQKDAESKRLRADALASHEQLAKDKTEFLSTLQQFKLDKAEFEKTKSDHDIDKAKVSARLEQIGHFIQAVKRDISVLGL